MSHFLKTILFILIAMNSLFANDSFQIKYERILDLDLREFGDSSTFEKDVLRDVQRFLYHSEEKRLYRETLADNLWKYSERDGLLRFAKKYKTPSLGNTKRNAQFYLSDRALGILDWAKIELPRSEVLVRSYYFSGQFYEFSKFIYSKYGLDIDFSKKINIDHKRETYSGRVIEALKNLYNVLKGGVKKEKAIDAPEITKEDLLKTRRVLIGENGEVRERFIGKNGSYEYIKAVDALDSKTYQHEFNKVELALNENQLRDLMWQIEFISLENKDARDVKSKRVRDLLNIKVISVNSSVKRGSRK